VESRSLGPRYRIKSESFSAAATLRLTPERTLGHSHHGIAILKAIYEKDRFDV
jgi:hypothetical protein